MAIFVRDTQFTNTTLNGKPHKAGKFAYSLRKHVFEEHLGLLERQRERSAKFFDAVSDVIGDTCQCEMCAQSLEPSPINVEDIVCDDFWLNQWWATATRNTQIYEQVSMSSGVPLYTYCVTGVPLYTV